jgi:hypothetical protein
VIICYTRESALRGAFCVLWAGKRMTCELHERTHRESSPSGVLSASRRNSIAKTNPPSVEGDVRKVQKQTHYRQRICGFLARMAAFAANTVGYRCCRASSMTTASEPVGGCPCDGPWNLRRLGSFHRMCGALRGSGFDGASQGRPLPVRGVVAMLRCNEMRKQTDYPQQRCGFSRWWHSRQPHPICSTRRVPQIDLSQRAASLAQPRERRKRKNKPTRCP